MCNLVFSHKNNIVIKEPRSHSIPDVKETLQNSYFLQNGGNSNLSTVRKTPYVNVAEMDHDALDNYSDDDYVNDGEMKTAVSSLKTYQS